MGDLNILNKSIYNQNKEMIKANKTIKRGEGWGNVLQKKPLKCFLVLLRVYIFDRYICKRIFVLSNSTLKLAFLTILNQLA